jgi:hypothetical protein
LNSEASILPRRMSAALKRWRSSCGRVKSMKGFQSNLVVLYWRGVSAGLAHNVL